MKNWARRQNMRGNVRICYCNKGLTRHMVRKRIGVVKNSKRTSR